MSADPVSRRLVNGQLQRVQASVRRLERFSAIPPEAFQADADNYAIAEHHLRLALEAALDTARHLVARLRLGQAVDYPDLPRLLREAGVLSDAAGTCMERSARLRNRLVHVYWQVDASELLARIPEATACLRAFCSDVAAYLQTRPTP